MAFCLPKFAADDFKSKLVDGSINPEKLSGMTSAERRAFFSDFLGEDDAKHVNALFESKLLLKNQQQGIINWAKSVSGMKPEVMRDILSKVEKMQDVLQPKELDSFLADLAEHRLGVAVTTDEAGKLVDLSKQIDETKAKIPEGSPNGSKERLDYGTALALFKEYAGGLKNKAREMSAADYLKHPGEVLFQIAGASKSILSTLDNSFFGRQGVKMLYTNPDLWARSFVKSWGDIGRELKGQDAMLPIKADVFSRENAINGKYKAGNYALGINSEEAFPSQILEKIPLLGRAFRGAESAYNGAALRLRADLADRVIQKADEAGIDTTDKAQAESLGKLVNSLTGRGNIGRADVLGKEINAAFFSVKFLKSNFDTLTAHLFDRSMSDFARKQAATNLATIVIGTGAVLGVAKMLNPNSVDFDPRSSNFGKIKIGDTTFDITGGMASLVTLASRVTPTVHNGQWGFYSKSGTSGNFNDLHSGKYGSQTALDVFDGFWQGKLSPLAGVVRDVWEGTDYNNKPVTAKGEALQAGTPLPIATFEEMKSDPNAAPLLLGMILDGLGFSSQTYAPPAKKK